MNEVHEFLPGLRLIEGTREVAGGSNTVLSLHATHLHAHMAGLDNHHYAEGFECLLNALLDLERHPFLYLQTMAVDIDHTGYL